MTATQDLNIGSLRALHRALILVVSLLVGAPAFAEGNPIWSSALADGSAQRAQGNLTLALESLEAARRAAVTPSEQAMAAGEFGAALVQARRYDEAEAQLRQAYDFSGDIARARYAVDLGNLAALRKRPRPWSKLAILPLSSPPPADSRRRARFARSADLTDRARSCGAAD